MLKYKIYNLISGYETNTYLVWETESLEAVLIDPAAPDKILKDDINELGLSLKMIINTHGHGDHIGGNHFFAAEFKCPVAIHKNDAAMLLNDNLNFTTIMGIPYDPIEATILFEDNDNIQLGNIPMEIFHTPGHTTGCIVIYSKPYLFSGDTLFLLEVGRCDLPGGNYYHLKSSIRKKIFVLPDDTIVLPGHGDSTTVGREKLENPYMTNPAL